MIEPPAIVSPQRGRTERKVLRRVTAFRRAKWCAALNALAVAALIGSLFLPSLPLWLLLLGFGACALALVAAAGAVFYRITETPRQVTVRSPPGWPPHPRVIHFSRED